MRRVLAAPLLLAALALAPACNDEAAGASTAAGATHETAGSGASTNVSVGPQVFGSGGAAGSGPLIAARRDEALSDREAVLGWSLALVAALGTASFLLSGRVGASVHVALSLLCVLIAVFGLYLLLGTASAFGAPVAAVVALAVLLAVLKLMSRFETTLKPKDGPRN